MNYEYLDMGAYHLHFIKTKKFKTITVEVNFRRKIKKEEITIRNLLKAVLLTTNKNFKTEREFIKETENLYDLKLISSNMRIGNYSNLSFKIRFLNEKYTEKDMNEYSITFLMDLLFQPDIVDNAFKKEEVEKCKRKLEKSIQKLKDNKLKYTLFKLLETTDNQPYSYNSFGYIEDIDKITSKGLYDYYKSVLNDDYVDVFIVGDVDSLKIRDIFKKYFHITTFKKERNDILVSELIPRKRIKKVKEESTANASQLTAFCTLNHLTDFERKYVLLVYNEMLGGSSNSLLFDTVRERNSYAYYVNSNSKAYDNLLLIYAGIEKGNAENVLKLIRKTLINIGKGMFDEVQFSSAKETLVASVMASTDSPTGIINTYYAMKLVNSDEPMERVNKINQVTKDDIIAISKKITLHTVYLLEGTSEGDNQ